MRAAENWIGVSVGVLLLLVLVGFWVRQLTSGGWWGQRPNAHRVRALGGVLMFGALAAAAVGAIAHQRAVIAPAGFVLVAAIIVVMVGEPLGRYLDRRRTQQIRRDLDLD